MRAVVLVEGVSDQRALEALAMRRGRDLARDGVAIVPMGGATNIRAHLDHYGPRGLDVMLAGLFDAGEIDDFRRALERAGCGAIPNRRALEARGFYACDTDLEDELIRALGVAAVEAIVQEAGEMRAFRTLQKQPAQLGRTTAAQLHRFIGSKSGRKARYASLMVDALDLTNVPRPLDRVLARV
jgi:hypothetical protein